MYYNCAGIYLYNSFDHRRQYYIYYVNTSDSVWTYLEVILEICRVITEAREQGPNLRLQKLIAVGSDFISLILQSNTSFPIKKFLLNGHRKPTG